MRIIGTIIPMASLAQIGLWPAASMKGTAKARGAFDWGVSALHANRLLILTGILTEFAAAPVDALGRQPPVR